jgi:hypothetical protein
LITITSSSKQILLAFLAIANTIFRGEDACMHQDLQFLRRSRGIALEKDLSKTPPDVRPLGVNEVFLNAIACIALKRYGGDLAAHLHKHDCGFGVSAGTEKIIHAIQACYSACVAKGEPFAVGKKDFTNAFGSSERQDAIHVIREETPALLHFLAFRYTNATVLYEDVIGSITINIETGVSQGCPLSPLIFQLVMSKTLASVRSNPAHATHPTPSYLDDVHSVTRGLRPLAEIYSTIRDSSAERNLVLNARKCKILWVSGSRPESREDSNGLAVLRRMHIEVVSDGLEVLGGFIGSPAFRLANVRKSFAKMHQRLTQFETIVHVARSAEYRLSHPEPLVQKLLKFVEWCLAPLPTSLLRTTAVCNLCMKEAQKFDDHLVGIVLLIIDAPPPLVTAPTFASLRTELAERRAGTRVKLSPYLETCYQRFFLRAGGLGLQSASRTAIAGYLGSIALCSEFIEDMLMTVLGNNGPFHVASLLGYQVHEARLERSHSELHPTVQSPFPCYRPHESRTKFQARLSDLLQAMHVQTLKQTFTVRGANRESEFDEFRFQNFLSSLDPWSGVWRHATTKIPYCVLPDRIASDALTIRVGLDPALPAGGRCRMCQKPVLGPPEIHAKVCSHTRGPHKTAGTIFEKGVFTAVKRFEPDARAIPRLDDDPRFPKKREDKPAKKFADIASTHGDHIIIADVTFTNDVPANVKACGDPNLAPAEVAAARKLKQYTDNRVVPPGCFVAMACDIRGAWGSEMRQYFVEMHDKYKFELGVRHSPLLRFTTEHVSRELAKCAHLYLNSMRFGLANEDQKAKREESMKQKATSPKKTKSARASAASPVSSSGSIVAEMV